MFFQAQQARVEDFRSEEPHENEEAEHVCMSKFV